MGAHSAGRRTWSLGRSRLLTRLSEAALVLGLVGLAAVAGWTSFESTRPPGSVLNRPHTTLPQPSIARVPADRATRTSTGLAPASPHPSTPSCS